MTNALQPDNDNLPAHIAIIMDGNGRWAQERGLIRLMGHKAGVKTVQEIVRAAREMGIRVLTLYAFSSENWKRPPKEVSGLMSLLKSYLESELASMLQNDISLRCIGNRENLPAEVRRTLEDTIAKTADKSGLILNLALSYGAREEIIHAVKKIARSCADGAISPEQISDQLIADHLFTAGLPDPDLVIRTGGEYRLSNFLLWQSSYAEFYFTETMWPDFSKDHFAAAIASFQQRQRRFGKTGDQVKN